MIEIFTTGGTIDKVYFDANSEFEIGDSLIAELLAESNIHDGYTLNGLLRKDSLECKCSNNSPKCKCSSNL